MTPEEAVAVLRKYLDSLAVFASEIQDRGNLVLRWHTAMKQPELASALAEYEAARAALVNPDSVQLAEDVAILVAALEELNS